MIYSDIHLAPFSALIHSLLAHIYANMLLDFDDIPSVLHVQYTFKHFITCEMQRGLNESRPLRPFSQDDYCFNFGGWNRHQSRGRSFVFYGHWTNRPHVLAGVCVWSFSYLPRTDKEAAPSPVSMETDIAIEINGQSTCI